MSAAKTSHKPIIRLMILVLLCTVIPFILYILMKIFEDGGYQQLLNIVKPCFYIALSISPLVFISIMVSCFMRRCRACRPVLKENPSDCNEMRGDHATESYHPSQNASQLDFSAGLSVF